MYQPLAGIKILDCTRLLPYQYCTMLLGDLGAEVLKVEEPREGDYGRWGDGARTYESDAFVMANRNKKSMKLNLKHDKGKEILKKLAVEYDVLIESFRPGVMDRLGVGYEDMKQVNPAIIYCSTTGFGQTGPYRRMVGHDINYLGYSGILAWTGEHTGRPVVPGIPIGDMAGGGLVTAMAVLSALVGRERTGKGQYIDVGQADVLLSLNIRNTAEVLARRKGRTARPVDVRGLSLCYNTYRTSDDKFVALGAVEPKFWSNFCKTVGKEEWVENHLLRYEDGSEMTEALKTLFASKSRDEWEKIFKDVESCITPVLTPDEALENEHYKERGMIFTMDDPDRGETLQIGFPAKFSDELNFKRSPAPFFGQHTDEVLAGIGFTKQEIEELRNEGVIDVPQK
ncbi:MAG: CoA transferase [Deltaproteobacteria bacterium]|nr:MAG: CoA transferase [Deltaproteobacteria bacterium]